MVAGIVKNFNVSFDYALYEMSMVNVQMYNAVLPSYDDEKQEKPKNVIDANDPKNQSKVDDFFNKINGL